MWLVATAADGAEEGHIFVESAGDSAGYTGGGQEVGKGSPQLPQKEVQKAGMVSCYLGMISISLTAGKNSNEYLEVAFIYLLLCLFF